MGNCCHVKGEFAWQEVHDIQHVTGVMPQRVALVDEVADVQSLTKPDSGKTYAQLADHFTTHVLRNYDGVDEIRIIYDRYDI